MLYTVIINVFNDGLLFLQLHNYIHSPYLQCVRLVIIFIYVIVCNYYVFVTIYNYISIQVDKNPVQVDNIHNILTFAAFRFSAQQVDHLFQLIQKVKPCRSPIISTRLCKIRIT